MDQPFVRRRISLDGTWQFAIDPAAEHTSTSLQPDRTIVVPGAWQAQHDDLRRYSGTAWYERTIDLPAWPSDQVPHTAVIHLGAVDHECAVWINDTPVGDHIGGYTPVELPIGHVLHGGSNRIVVRVRDRALAETRLERWPDDARIDPANEMLHGKQGWYVDVSGIWGQTWVDLMADANVAQIHCTPYLATSSVTLDVHLRLPDTTPHGDLQLMVAVGRSDGPPQITRTVTIDHTTITLDLPIADVRPWSPDDPALYVATAMLLRDNQPIDQISARFGMREIAARDGRLWLNGEPLYLRAALDQDFYPDTIYTPSIDMLRAQLEAAKQIGLNCVRAHIKPVDPRYLDLCDELGLLVWAELPSWRSIWLKNRAEQRQPLPVALQQQAEQTFREMVARDFNHPSIVIWTLVNEDWGTQLVFQAEDRAWLHGFYERAKAIDSTRLVVDNSACNSQYGPNFHVQTDLDDFHVYAAMPEEYHSFERWVEDFSQRPLWTFSPYGDATRRGDEPLIVSEFGTWGLPTMAALRQHWPDGEPWWWNTGAWWGGEMSYSAGVEERFAESGLTAIWPTFDQFARATQAHEHRALKAQIELIRRQPTIQGYVITELADQYWEANGLLDFYRQPKSFHNELSVYNSADILIPQSPRGSYWGGDRLRVPVVFSHWSGQAAAPCTLRWTISALGLDGTWTIDGMERGQVHLIGAIDTTLPDVDMAQHARIDIWLEQPDGTTIARTFHDLVVVAKQARAPQSVIDVYVHDPRLPDLDGDADDIFRVGGAPHAITDTLQDAGLTEIGQQQARGLGALLPQLGYRALSNPARADLIVATRVDQVLLDQVRAGGSLLFLPRGTSPLLPVAPRGKLRDGEWISAFHWLRPDLHWSIPIENPLGFAFANILPRTVILGHGPLMTDDVLGGMTTGWAHLPAATICQFRYGAGRVVMCTWQLSPFAGRDPVATALLHNLIAYAASEQCQPTMHF